MQPIIDILAANPLLLLFVVTAIGYPLGRIKFKGSSLGVAAVLFVGLAVGALSPDLKLPDIIFTLGLVVFVYTIGLSSGPGFFASFRRKGLRDNLFILIMLLVAAGMTVGWYLLLGLKPSVTAGMFAGSLTNTPALAGLLDYINNSTSVELRTALLAEPVVGYSVAYPMGVLGMLLAIFVTQKLWKIDFKTEAAGLREFNAVDQNLYNRTVRITQPGVIGVPLRELTQKNHWDVVFGRMNREGQTTLALGSTALAKGDLLSIIGAPEEVDRIAPLFGALTEQHLELDRSTYDFRRIFVSNPEIAGLRLEQLSLPRRYGALVTRIRRGDVDLLAHGDTQLELGDRVRVVARREDLAEIAKLFGDSYKALSEVDMLTFGLGLTLGLLVGLIPIPLPGGTIFKLGSAGGPLIVALILGARRRTGPISWSMPYSANLTLRQIGLIMLLAGIGLRSGYTFVNTFTQSGGFSIFLAAATVTTLTGFLTLFIGYKVLKIPYGLLIGMLSALQTQPAVLGYSLEQAENDLPNIGYALVFPLATISKILIAQLLLTFLK